MGNYTSAGERAILYDEDNDQFYVLGTWLNAADKQYYQILSAKSDGTNKLTYQFPGSPLASNIIKVGDYSETE